MSMILYIAVMPGITYLIRMIPFTLFRKKIKSNFIQSILYYIHTEHIQSTVSAVLLK